jgi:DNA invertase Pin-like site-specific DNA recombinase
MSASQSSMSLRAEKILARHRDRLAIVYVRQSTTRQVLQNQESTRLQYALVERACQLGWPREQVVVIDDDLGRSATSTRDRPGFQRLVAEVGLGRVGLVLGIDVSRLARSCRDWHQLLEMCALFDALIADADGVYDASHFNDRLLLGLKGTMSEAELHVLRSRMHEGRRAKARRGELVIGLPRGYVLLPSGAVALDPDEQVRAAVQLVFDVFERRRSVRGVLRHLVEHELELPDRVRSGPHKGEVRWNRPNYATLSNMLRHPAYAGAYVYGRRRMDPRAQLPGKPHSGRHFLRDQAQWQVLQQGCWPAYIGWETYTRNQAQMAANRSEHGGVPRGGPALAAGLVRCGRCGHRMAVGYHNNGREARYLCNQLASTYGESRCQSVSAQPIDTALAELILAALTPSAVEVSLQLAEDLELERTAQRRQWAQRLERARYETALARRRYEAVDPQNRLVARTLEHDWEVALAAEQALQAEHERALARQPLPLQAEEKEVIRKLAEDVPALWHAPTTTAADRQAIAHLVLEQVVVRVERNSEHVELECHWAGGPQTRHELTRTVRRFAQLRQFDRLLAEIRTLREQGDTAATIAEKLNAAGWRPPKRETFNEATVLKLLRQYQCSAGRASWVGRIPRQPGREWTLHEVAQRLGVHRCMVYRWMCQGRLNARLATQGRHRIWLVRMDEADLAQLQSQAAAPAPSQSVPKHPT